MYEKSSFSKRSSAPEGRTIDLDQARVASMADEGGAAGATRDAQEQGEALDIEIVQMKPAWTWLAIGVIAGCAAVLGAMFTASQTRAGRFGFGRRRRSWLFG